MARMDDGYQTLITFADDSSVSMWEKEVTPPGVEGGGEIDTTVMANATWKTFFPQTLKTLTESSLVVAYDPAVYTDIITMINQNQLITITFPGGETIAFWGWIKSFVPGANVIGEQPTADLTIKPSNQNDSLVETPPVIG